MSFAFLVSLLNPVQLPEGYCRDFHIAVSTAGFDGEERKKDLTPYPLPAGDPGVEEQAVR